MKKGLYLLLLYYVVLLVLLVSRQNVTVEPPLLARIVFITAVVLPVFANKDLFFPAILTLFYSLTAYGFMYSYMPTMLYIYAIVTLLLLFVKGAGNSIYIPSFIIVFTIYIVLIDMLNYGDGNETVIYNTSYCLLLLLASLWVVRDKQNSLNQLSTCFLIISIVLSALFLLNRQRFVVDYGYNTGLERSGWTDPNYFGCVIGMGFVISMITLFRNDNKFALGRGGRLLSIATLIFSTPALVLNASRGAILSVVLSSVILLLFSKIKTNYKVLFVILSAGFMYFLYTAQYFDLLEYRVENDVGGGSDRVVIWAEKLKAFNEGGFLNILIGYGHDGGWRITGELRGFHNDYVGFLVEYGIIGVLLFLYMLYYPLKVVFKKSGDKIAVLSLMVYLMVDCFTLEPFGIGSLTFFVFYMYAVIMAEKGKQLC